MERYGTTKTCHQLLQTEYKVISTHSSATIQTTAISMLYDNQIYVITNATKNTWILIFFVCSANMKPPEITVIRNTLSLIQSTLACVHENKVLKMNENNTNICTKNCKQNISINWPRAEQDRCETPDLMMVLLSTMLLLYPATPTSVSEPSQPSAVSDRLPADLPAR